MSTEDPLKKIILDSALDESGEPSKNRVDQISKAISRKDTQSKVMDFGIVKIWTVLLELFSVFYVRAQERTVEVNKADIDEK